MKSVYSAVRPGALNRAVCAWALKVNIATTVRSAHTLFMRFVSSTTATTPPVTPNKVALYVRRSRQYQPRRIPDLYNIWRWDDK